ncbi:MAG: hypothetical protein WBY53_06470 [Acidobacteriaceae bacterium]
MDELPNYEEMLEVAIQESKLFEQMVTAELCNLPIDTVRRQLSFLLVLTALQHYRAVIHLLDDGEHRYSAFALVRPIADAAMRAVWLAQFATDDQVMAANSDHSANMFPSSNEIARLIEQKWGLNSKYFKQDWTTLSGYVHTGIQQLNERMIYNPTNPFPHKQALSMLMKSSTYLWLGACYVATGAGNINVFKRIDEANDKLFKTVGFSSKINP